MSAPPVALKHLKSLPNAVILAYESQRYHRRYGGGGGGEVIATQPVLFNGKCTKMGFSCFSEQILANYLNAKRTTKQIIDSKVRREKGKKNKQTNKQNKP